MTRSVNFKLKAAIIETGRTMSSFAEEINTTPAQLSRKINGFRKFNEDEIYVISRALNKSVTEIFFNFNFTKCIKEVS